MANYIATDAELTSVANKIRSKTGSTASLEWPDGFVSGINSISGGGSPTLETVTKTYTPTESQQTETIEPGQGYDGIGEVDVTVGAISGSYVGSGVTRRSSSDLSASGATVTAPAGYYESAASKAVASGSAATPATSITANPTISVSSGGLITASVSATKSITPTVSAGYVSSGTAGTATVSGSATEQLTVQAAQTIHPSASDQTIASGKYLTGAQTVKGVLLTNLLASVIKKDEVVKVGDADDDDCVASVTGTYEGGGSGITMATGSVTGNGTHTISISGVKSKPYIIVYYRSDMGSMTAVSDRATSRGTVVGGIGGGSLYTSASSTTETNGGFTGGSAITDGTSPVGNNRAAYNSATETLYIKSGNNSNLWSTSLTYNYELYFVPTS